MFRFLSFLHSFFAVVFGDSISLLANGQWQINLDRLLHYGRRMMMTMVALHDYRHSYILLMKCNARVTRSVQSNQWPRCTGHTILIDLPGSLWFVVVCFTGIVVSVDGWSEWARYLTTSAHSRLPVVVVL